MPCPFPGDPPNSEIEMGLLVVPAPQAIYLPLSHREAPIHLKDNSRAQKTEGITGQTSPPSSDPGF